MNSSTIKLKLNNKQLEKVSIIQNNENYSLTHIMNALLEEYNKSRNLRKKIYKIINNYDSTHINGKVFKND